MKGQERDEAETWAGTGCSGSVASENHSRVYRDGERIRSVHGETHLAFERENGLKEAQIRGQETNEEATVVSRQGTRHQGAER